MKISTKFGNEEDLGQLLDEAHKRGMRVILDLVPNHSGLGFGAFQDIIKNGKDSPYWDWYFVHIWPFSPGDPQAYEAWWGVGSLPKLNTGNPQVKEYLFFKVIRHWLNFGADGWRVDVHNELVKAKEFFNEMRQLVKMEKPDAYLIAEIWQLDPSCVQGDQFDSLMNYALGRDILLNFAKGSVYGEGTLDSLSRYFDTYGENVTVMGFNLVSSHDTGRLLTDLKREKFGFPGMKILQFSFDDKDPIKSRPDDYEKHCVVYTGTHDNDTLLEWYRGLKQSKNTRVLKILEKYYGINNGMSEEKVCWELIEVAYKTNANFVIVPLQDILCLDNEARMNYPGTVGGNWLWRYKREDITKGMEEKLAILALKYNR